IYEALCSPAPSLRPRYASLRTLYQPSSSSIERQVLDSSALVLYFPAPYTVTGEDVLELHIHGGPAILKAVLAAIPKAGDGLGAESRKGLHVIRYAEPGEFTRRAFYNNRLDLTQIEALGDSLSAETEQQRRLAVRGTQNALTERYIAWRSQLLYARGELEALIDFSEDQHLEESPTKLVASVTDQVNLLGEQLQTSIRNACRGELLRNGIKIALLGAPNAGKSSLMNVIVGREAAIVSGEAGTTRDVLEFDVDIGGFLCRFGDLAGLRGPRQGGSTCVQKDTTIGEVEQEGIQRAKKWISGADVVLVVLPVEPLRSESPSYKVSVSPEVVKTLSECTSEEQTIIYVVNKIDLVGQNHNGKLDMSAVEQLDTFRPAEAGDLDRIMESVTQHSKPPIFYVSCKEAQGNSSRQARGGINLLLEGLTNTFAKMTSAEGAPHGKETPFWEQSLGASERQRILIIQCQQHLDEFLLCVHDIVLAAESLRAAADCLARITGKGEAGDVEEVLGVVFEKFCVGK
ncbi:mitochondrial splicing system protein, partial [Trapelia coarctata]|nr:mitochondrial splicing system protein [Trapelia coarctata]